MLQDLINMPEFYVFTFPTTYMALRAEKVLEMAGQEFILIPTPREITRSCGLSVKCSPGEKDKVAELLRSKQIAFSGVHKLNRKH